MKYMLSKWLRAAALGSAALLTACGGMNMADDMPQRGYRTNAIGESHGVSGDNGYGNHQNRSLVRSGEMARAIENLDGIARAEVVFGSGNAYVGVVLDEKADESSALGGSSARSSSSPEEYGMKGNYYGATDSRVFPAPGRGGKTLEEVGTSDAAREMYGLAGSDGGIGGVAMHRSGSLGAEGGRTGASSVTDAGGASARSRAYWSNNGLSQQVRARVESIVRSIEPNIRNVYISGDPDVVERLSRTAAVGDEGVESFNAWAARVFGAEDANRYDIRMRDGKP